MGMLSIPLSALGLLLGAIGLLVALTRRGSGIGYPIGGGVVSGLALAIGIAQVAAVGSAVSAVAERPSMALFGREQGKDESNTIGIGQTLKLGNIEVRPLGVWKRRVKYPRGSYFDTEETLYETDEPVLVLAFEVSNHSTGEVFDPLGPGDAWDYSSITDEYGNRSLAHKMFDLDLRSFEGHPKEDLQPGTKKNVMLLVDELTNPNATSFTWKVKFIVSNKFSSETVCVKFSAADVKP
ncbi:MAG: hypothetical protein KAY37_16250 [Phycisphaerae bacterium]|nr:hypothetical protein [Phycisphaerae bacterium]